MKYRCLAALGAALSLLFSAPLKVARWSARPAVAEQTDKARTPAGRPVSARNTRGRATQPPQPSGCSSDGPYSGAFISDPSSPNYAGGSPRGFLAGVLAGGTNEACDTGSGIGAGYHNTVGGDESAQYSLISAGSYNAMEHARDSFIGAGIANILSGAAPYGASYESAIASGDGNTIGSPVSFIGTGYGNAIAATTIVNNGQSAFIGGGEYNSVAGSFSAITAGSTNVVSGNYATVAAGADNRESGDYGFVGAGEKNVATGKYAVVDGGARNSASGEWTVV